MLPIGNGGDIYTSYRSQTGSNRKRGGFYSRHAFLLPGTVRHLILIHQASGNGRDYQFGIYGSPGALVRKTMTGNSKQY